MKYLTATLCLVNLFLFTQGRSYANDIEQGEALHAEHCHQCQKVDVYTRANRIVENLPQLGQRVEQCELMNDLLWFDEEVNDVTAYLNAHFYLFGIK